MAKEKKEPEKKTVNEEKSSMDSASPPQDDSEKFEIEDIKDPEEDAKQDGSPSAHSEQAQGGEQVRTAMAQDESADSEDLDMEEAISEEEKLETEAEKAVGEEKVNPKELSQENTEPEVKKVESAPIKIEKVGKKSKKGLWKTIFIVMVVALITTALVLGGVWWYMNKYKTKNEEPAKTTVEETKPVETEAKATVSEKVSYVSATEGLRMRKEPNPNSEILATIPYGTKLVILEEQDGWIKTTYDGKTGWCSKEYTTTENPLVYANTDYDFTLTFPQTWGQYKVVKKNVEGTTATYYVLLPTTDKNWTSSISEPGYASLMAISVYTKAQYDAEKAGEGGHLIGTPTATKGDYVFIASSGQATPSDLEARFGEIKAIIDTLEVA